MKKINIYILASLLAFVSACTYEFPAPDEPTSGTADFTKVVAVGNSLTAGFMDGALYDAGQAASYANLVALQIKANGGGDFNQPDIDAADGFYGMAPDGTTVLGHLILVNPLSPAPTPIIPGQLITPYSGNKAELNNFGVPGIRLIDVDVNGYGNTVNGNPYYSRFASDPNTSSVLDDAIAANGTFIIFWLGNNDVLGYATAGATDPADLTDASVFDAKYKEVVAKLITDDGKQGVLMNIPYVKDVPFFTTVAWNSIVFDASDPDDSASIAALNAGYAAYNGGLDGLVGVPPFNLTQEEADARKISFGDGANGVVILDLSLTDLTGADPNMLSMRQTTSGDLLTLLAGAVLPAGEGTQTPLGEEYTLTPDDISAINNRIDEFNTTIKSVVDASGGDLALLDVNMIFSDFALNGATINGAAMDATMFPPFGAFSLDGIHPNQRGYAFVASLLIDEINESFGSNIPNLNPNNWPGNAMPIVQ